FLFVVVCGWVLGDFLFFFCLVFFFFVFLGFFICGGFVGLFLLVVGFCGVLGRLCGCVVRVVWFVVGGFGGCRMVGVLCGCGFFVGFGCVIGCWGCCVFGCLG
ncbi:hypothetical protein, partial [Pseudomonas syringae group genomosp. 7]|uniref:hypothetical protein n=1 Tax=Pseudomonas syringae group genomosp. 7 TaxID=251699 RepID=UPI00376F8B9C